MSEQHELWTCPQCGNRLDISQLGFFAEVVCSRCHTQATVHGMLANYKVEAVLGIGGMSVVFQARDLVLGRPLAIKVLNDTYRDAPQRIAGFENECSLMAKVRHENVVAVYSAGWARGQFFIAMELVEGQNLELLVTEKGSLPPMQAVEIIRQVALGLQAAHAAGILHRDVKPGNVIINQDGQAKVLDFGLSLDEKGGVEDDEIIWATPYYVPPETLRREEESVRADIYALGMTLRNLLTGEAKLAGDPHTIADMLVAKKVIPLLSSVSPGLEPSLCALVDKMTSFEPENRYSDYAAVLSAVAKVQKKMRDAVDPTFQAQLRRRKLYLACGVMASLAAGLLGGVTASLLTPSSQIQEVLNADRMQWKDRDAYNEALALLQRDDTAQALDRLSSLLDEDADPAISAVASMLRVALAVLDGKSGANEYYRFSEVAARAESVSPAGQAVFDELVSFMSALKKNVADAETIAAGLENPVLKSAALVLVADAYAYRGDAAKLDALLDQSAGLLDADGYAGIKEKLGMYRESAPVKAADIRLEEVKNMFYSGKYEEALAAAPGMLEMALSDAEKEEIKVLSEATTLMVAMHEALARHGRSVTPGMAPADLRASSTGVSKNQNLHKEFYCIALLLIGDYDSAFRVNPYSSDESDEVPFNVMMRDWAARLNK